MRLIHTAFTNWLQSAAIDAPYSPHTMRLYSKVAGDFDEFCIEESIDICTEFGISHVRKFIGASRDGVPYARSTTSTRLVVLDLIFSYLQDEDDCRENPVAYYRDTKLKKRGGTGGRAATRLPECLSWGEQDRLLHASMADETFTGYRNSAIIALILDSGLRTQEIVDLPLSAAADCLAGHLRVVGKGNKERLIRFTPTHSEYVSSWLKKRHAQNSRLKKEFDDRLFVSERGGPMCQQTVYYAVEKLLLQANIKSKQQNGGHLLRHTAASIMLAKGMALKQVQENLGHSSLMTTERYLHLLKQQACN
jgi:site-specific recombinase XerD